MFLRYIRQLCNIKYQKKLLINNNNIKKLNFHSSKNLFLNIKNNNIGKNIITNNTENIPKSIGYWLLGCGMMVGGMVVIGGITRLTRSGLSMTKWKFTGSLPPMNNEEWLQEFNDYKNFPEYSQRNKMTLDEFKKIYFWEYIHRMMGRVIGLVFIGPLIYFSIRGKIPKTLYKRLGILFGLGATQGLVGWWMVKSGLNQENVKEILHNNREIRVSPYRLTAHLGMAFITYILLLLTSFNILYPMNNYKNQSIQFINKLKNIIKPGENMNNIIKKLLRLRRLSHITTGLVLLTALSGAFVAGIDAGHAYNSFPKMGDDWIPEEMWNVFVNNNNNNNNNENIINKNEIENKNNKNIITNNNIINDNNNKLPLWRNFFENTALVQFDHRILALTTLGLISLVYFKSRSLKMNELKKLWSILPKQTKNAFNINLSMVYMQVTLGITTLLHYVPISLASLHQFGSIALLTSSTFLLHSFRFARFYRDPKFIKNILEKIAKK